MRKSVFILLGVGALLSGCAATIAPVEVTRFHQGQAGEKGSMKLLVDSSSIEGSTYAAAVSRELTRLGYTDANSANPQFVAKMNFSRDVRTERQPSPVSVGIGAGTGGGNIGIGVGTSIPLGSTVREYVTTFLSVQLVRASDNKPIWEGRASTTANAKSPAAQPGLAAGKLAAALFGGYPGESGKTITVQ